MNLQNENSDKSGFAIRATSSVLLLTATVLLVGSLYMARSVKPSPNSGRVTNVEAISLIFSGAAPLSWRRAI